MSAPESTILTPNQEAPNNDPNPGGSTGDNNGGVPGDNQGTPGDGPGTGEDPNAGKPGADGDKGEGNGEGEGEGDKGKQGAPEKYEDFTFPDGITPDKALVDSIVPEFKELNLSQEQAQKLVSKYADFVAQQQKQNVDAWNELITKWSDDAKKDPEIGGQAFDTNIKTALNLLDKFGSPELKKDLGDYGFGNNPHLVKFLVKMGKEFDEAPHRMDGNTNNPGKNLSLAERMYGTK